MRTIRILGAAALPLLFVLVLALVPGSRGGASAPPRPAAGEPGTAPPPAVAPAPPEEAAPAGRPVRDLADGSEVSGCRSPAEAERAGYAVVSSPEEAEHDGEVWVRRDILVRGTVRFRGEVFDPAVVGLAASIAAPDGPPGPGREWLAAHGLCGPFPLPPPGQAGEFEARLPRVAGLTVEASADGYAGGRETVPLDARTDEAEVRLELFRGIPLEGILTGPDGAPVAGALVLASVAVRGRYADGDVARIREKYPEGGVAVRRSEAADTALVTVLSRGRTDAEGRFRFDLRETGEVVLTAYAPGLAPAERDLGRVVAARRDLSLGADAPARPGATVLLTRNGAPLAGAQVVVTDITRDESVAGLPMEADADGRISADWLVEGRKYALTVTGRSAGAPDGAPDASGARTTRLWKGQGEIAFPARCGR